MPFLDRLLPRLDRIDRDRLEGIIRDLAREREFLRGVLDLLADGIVVTDREGRIRLANRAAGAFLARGRDLAAGGALADALADAGIRRYVEEAVRARTHLPPREIEIGGGDRLIVAAVAHDDGAVFIVRNVTEETAREARRAWLKRLQIFSIMAAGIAHEIGNPLNSLDIHLQLIARKTRSPRGRKGEILDLLGVAQEEVRRLEAIVARFLKATRGDVLEMREGDIVGVLERALEFMRTEMERHGVALETRFDPSIPPVVLNPDQMRQVVINLVRNALQAMPGGGRLRVEASYARRQVLIRFADTGGGIPEEAAERIFEPYFTTKPGGTGLGLTIVQRIMSEHGGDVLVSPNPGGGTTMTARIPVPARYARLLPGQRATKGGAA
ncbi:MAG: ATP-binding protein [bacterium]|nr:ATP-binding protein [bacterium]